MDSKQNLFPVSAKSDNWLIQIKTTTSPTLKLTRDILVWVENNIGWFLTKITAWDIIALPAGATIADWSSRLFFLYASNWGTLSWSYMDSAITWSEFWQVTEEIMEYREDKRLLAVIDITNDTTASFIPATTALDVPWLTVDVYTSINVIDLNMSTADIADWAVTNIKLWWPKLAVIQETFALTDFTDNDDTTWTATFATPIPKGAKVAWTLISSVTWFIGDTSATITIWDWTDVDRYITWTPNVFADADYVDAWAVSWTAWHTAEKTPTLIITTDADFSSVTDWELTVTIFYYFAE